MSAAIKDNTEKAENTGQDASDAATGEAEKAAKKILPKKEAGKSG